MGRERRVGCWACRCGEECIHRTLKMFCDARVCPAGPTCSNRPFHLLKGPKVEPVPTPGRGWGGRAGERIAAGQFVIEYVGEVRTPAANC